MIKHYAVLPFLGQRLNRERTKVFVRGRIAELQEIIYESDDSLTLEEEIKYGKKLQNRCEQLKLLHRERDW